MPPGGGFVTTPAGYRLWCRDVGPSDAPALLFLHGNPTHGFLWRGVVARLCSRFRCLVPDLPGFGRSPLAAGAALPAVLADAVTDLLDGRHTGPVILVGHDWGLATAAVVAGRRPDRVAGLVATNGWAWPLAGQPRFALFARLMGGPPGRGLIRRCDGFVALGLRLGMRRRGPSKRVMRACHAPFRDPADRAVQWRLARATTGATAFLQEAEAGLHRIADRPALVAWGDRDPAFRASERRRLEGLLPRHETVILAGAGHFTPEDAPEALARAIAGRWGRAAPDLS